MKNTSQQPLKRRWTGPIDKSVKFHLVYIDQIFFTVSGANYKLQNQIDSRQSASAESEAKILQLTKEKDELLDLAMSRGKIIQVITVIFQCQRVLSPRLRYYS